MLNSSRFTCLQCGITKKLLPRSQKLHTARDLLSGTPSPSPPKLPSIAPKPSINTKHIRENPSLYTQTCLERNYTLQSTYPSLINTLFAQWHRHQHSARTLRERNNKLKLALANPIALQNDTSPLALSIQPLSKLAILAEARALKEEISKIEEKEDALLKEIDYLAAALPNLTSDETPRGDVPTVVGYINNHPEPRGFSSDRVWRSHVHIGSELNLLDFSSAATTSGWGWYYLLNEAALLEQALIQYSLSVAMSYGWRIVSPPTMIYSHISSACGFQPRDQNGEQQVYSIAQAPSDVGKKPEYSLAGTAEIPLAAMKANQTIIEDELPLKHVAVSRCYRAEAGARGVDTKGLYRVHEFTKVEMFAFTSPSLSSSTTIFDEMLSIQTRILTSLNLHCRILEMPSTDLGASASRKRDIEAFFPSRRDKDEGWGEVTSTSICTDYQTRRLGTKLAEKSKGGKMGFPWTVNGTALAVPRVLAAVLENGWDEEESVVRVPECLWPWMGGVKVIGPKGGKA